MEVYLLDADFDSLTVGWNPLPDSMAYELSMCSGISEDFEILSDKLKITVAKKKNLLSDVKYKFRVRSQGPNNVWSPYSNVSSSYSPLPPDAKQVERPISIKTDYCSITIQWDAVPNAIGYEMQYRSVSNDSANSMQWVTVPSMITNTFAKKKNLLHNVTYYFRVKPVFNVVDSDASIAKWVYGKPSNALTVATLAANLKSFLPTQLLRGKDYNVLANTPNELAGKLIGLYFSAHW